MELQMVKSSMWGGRTEQWRYLGYSRLKAIEFHNHKPQKAKASRRGIGKVE